MNWLLIIVALVFTAGLVWWLNGNRYEVDEDAPEMPSDLPEALEQAGVVTFTEQKQVASPLPEEDKPCNSCQLGTTKNGLRRRAATRRSWA